MSRRGSGSSVTHADNTALHIASSNTITHYAVPDGSTSLSPIWKEDQYPESQTQPSTESEYITSYIGTNSDPGEEQALRSGEKKEENMSDGERTEWSSGSGSEGELQEINTKCLKWKKGRVIGRGAYGKVYEGLLDSAKMMAVKEVEVDIGNSLRAQSVSLPPCFCSCQSYT